MRSLRRILVLCRVLVVVLVAGLYTSPARADDASGWWAMGDSLTRRNGYEYPYVMQPPATVVAEPGAHLQDVVEVQVPATVAAGATRVSVTVGTNNIIGPLTLGRPVMPSARFADGVDWMVAFLQASLANRLIVLATLPPPGMFPAVARWPIPQRALAEALATEYNGVLAEVARRRKCLLWTFPRVERERFLPDGFHPDREGHQTIARSLEALLPPGPPPPAQSMEGLWEDPFTWFPHQGPAGTVIALRGASADAVRRVVWFPREEPGGFRQLPVAERSAHLLTCCVPQGLLEPVELWAIRTPRPSRAAPNTCLGTFTVQDAGLPAPRVEGTWFGVLRAPGGTEVVVRLDLDQGADATVLGRAWVARQGAARRVVVRGSVEAEAADLNTGTLHLLGLLPEQTVHIRALAEGRVLRATAPLTGRLWRWE